MTLFAVVISTALSLPASLYASPPRPNVVFILCDNLGNGDIRCFHPDAKQRTPNLDQMAAEGMRLTSFYSASGVCTPSRAALMTGCYPRRVGLHVSYEGYSVLKPVDKRGLNPSEMTMAELFQSAGYVTACFGKWHLGDQFPFLPLQNGFDQFVGIPYSEDMMQGVDPKRPWPPLPLMKDNQVVEAPVDASRLTKQLTQSAVDFIHAHRDQPFFLYFPETGPGSRREAFPGEAFRGKSANGLYGDSIEELDWSAGEILKAIHDNSLDEKTLVVWTNDNGAVRRTPQLGSNAPYSGFGYSTSEGGMRMPCIVRWTGKIAPGAECTRLCSMMDWLPTFANLIDAKGPTNKIDGHDISALLLDSSSSSSPYDEVGFFYYQVDQLQAVRAGQWKLYLRIDNPVIASKDASKKTVPLALYDVINDVRETTEQSESHPEVVAKLTKLAEQARAEIGDGANPGSSQRESGWIENPQPLVLSPE